MTKYIFDINEIKDESIKAKVRHYQRIVHTVANENRDFTAAELRQGTKLLKELIADGVMAWWDQGLEGFIEDMSKIINTEEKNVRTN